MSLFDQVRLTNTLCSTLHSNAVQVMELLACRNLRLIMAGVPSHISRLKMYKPWDRMQPHQYVPSHKSHQKCSS